MLQEPTSSMHRTSVPIHAPGLCVFTKTCPGHTKSVLDEPRCTQEANEHHQQFVLVPPSPFTTSQMHFNRIYRHCVISYACTTCFHTVKTKAFGGLLLLVHPDFGPRGPRLCCHLLLLLSSLPPLPSSKTCITSIRIPTQNAGVHSATVPSLLSGLPPWSERALVVAPNQKEMCPLSNLQCKLEWW